MISILLPDLRGGGAERVSIDLARGFAALGHDVEFAPMQEAGEFLSEVQEGFNVFGLNSKRARNALPLVSAYLRARRPDAVLAMMWPLTAIVPIAAKLIRFNRPVLVCEHGLLSRQYEGWGHAHELMLKSSVAVGYRLADIRVGVSGGVTEDMALLSSLNASMIVPIHNPIRPLQAPDVHTAREALAFWNGNGPRILTVGTLKPVKNQALLVRAFARLPRKDSRLMFLGRGAAETTLRALAAELGVSDRVIFPGFIADPSPFYATADLFALSSDHEGFGNVIVEALSLGLPVVSTDCPSGPAEILENGRWGRLVPVGDAAALARAMENALAEPVDRDALKRRAADFAPEIAARKYLDLLGL